jgi:hypothetical protein
MPRTHQRSQGRSRQKHKRSRMLDRAWGLATNKAMTDEPGREGLPQALTTTTVFPEHHVADSKPTTGRSAMGDRFLALGAPGVPSERSAISSQSSTGINLTDGEPIGQHEQRRDGEQSKIAPYAVDEAKHGCNGSDRCSAKRFAVDKIEHSGRRQLHSID